MEAGMPPLKAAAPALLELPEPVLHLVLRHLWRQDDKRSLRLVCKGATALVERSTKRLRIIMHDPFKEHRSEPLTARFPALAALTLYASQDQAQQFDAFILDEQWTSITCLTTCDLPALPCMQAMRACPNLARCSINGSGFSFGVPEMVQHMAHALPSLADLAIDYPLGNEELAALAGCTSLRQLSVCVGTCSSSGWAAFLGSGVHSLSVRLDPETMPPDAWSTWASGMTALRELSLEASEGVHVLPTLCLPPSLTSLTTYNIHTLPSSVLPQLASLDLTGNELDSSNLSWIAGICPCLKHFDAGDLLIDMQSHANPFTALTSLTVFGTLQLAEGTRFAAVLPQLQWLELQGPCDVARWHESSFKGCTCLTYLDIGFSDTDVAIDEMFSMLSSDFEALSCLKALRLNASAMHVAQVSTLSQLQRLSMVVCRDLTYDPAGMGLDAAAEAFLSGHAPPQLLDVSFEFHKCAGCHVPRWPHPCTLSQYDAHQAALALAAIGTAAPSWLLRGAPLLHTLTWQQGDYAGLTDCSLFALAAHPSIKHIELLNPNSNTTAGMHQHIRRAFAARGLVLHVCPG